MSYFHKYLFSLAALVLGIIIAVTPSDTLADTIFLKNGSSLTGKIVSDTGDEIVIEISGAGTITLKRNEIESITIEPQEEKASGEAVNGIPDESQDGEKKPLKSDTVNMALIYLLPQFQMIHNLILSIFLIILLATLLVNSLSVWVAIMLFDPTNERNRYFVAFGWSAVIIVLSMITPLSWVVSLIALIAILCLYYRLTFFRAIASVVTVVVINISLALLAFLLIATLT